MDEITTMVSSRLSRLFLDERGEMAPGFKFLILFGVAAAIVYSIFTVYFVNYSVTQGAKDAARTAATEIFSTRKFDEGEQMATRVAADNGSDLADFKVIGSKVYVQLNHKNRLETFAKIRFLRHYIVTSATAEAEISRGNGNPDAFGAEP